METNAFNNGLAGFNPETILNHVQELTEATAQNNDVYFERWQYFQNEYIKRSREQYIPDNEIDEFAFLAKRFNSIDEVNDHIQERNRYFVDVNEHLEPPDKAISFINNDGKEAVICTKGDFSVIIGKAKSRKSFFVNILVSCLLKRERHFNRFDNYLSEPKNKVLYFDTEQSRYDVLKALKRLAPQGANVHNIETFSLRSLANDEKLKFVIKEIYSRNDVGFVVIDGIKDLITSINDEAQATMISSSLLKWTDERKIHVCVILHQNKSDTNARGHIGTELTNKAQTVLSVQKSETDKNISIVQAEQCRGIEPDTFAFEIDEKGIPLLVENFEIRTETKKTRFDVNDLPEDKLKELSNEVFSNKTELSYSDLQNLIKNRTKSILGTNVGDNRAKEIITLLKDKEYIFQEKQKAPYRLADLPDFKDAPKVIF
jgi:KaiC/GvpD/RAD55 family RecA-like ATPase